MHSALHNHQKQNRPLLPTTIVDIVIENEWAQTKTKDRFLCNYKENDNQMIIFASDNCLKALAESSRWHANGTFKCAVKDFQQVYIIHGLYRGHMIPLLKASCFLWFFFHGKKFRGKKVDEARIRNSGSFLFKT
jgi:hypothetical protein